MNSSEIRDCQATNNAILFKITSECNDNCSFCYAQDFMKKVKEPLSFNEIKKNFYYFKKRFKIDYIILTGGEPTLHPDFFSILDFFINEGVGFRFITNLIIFNDDKFVKNLKKRFSSIKNLKQKKITKIIASINDEYSYSEISKKRLLGFKEIVKNNFPFMLTVVIYERNVEKLIDLAKDLNRILARVPKDNKYHIELRPIYLKGDNGKIISRLNLPKHEILTKNIKKSLILLRKENSILTLWNYPLCYLSDYKNTRNETAKDRMSRRLILVSKNKQMIYARVRDWNKFLKSDKACTNCKERDKCGGLDETYLRVFSYPSLKEL